MFFYDIIDYFKDADKLCREFDKTNKITADSVEDEAAYQKQRDTLNKLIKLSTDIKKADLLDVEVKTKIGTEMVKVPIEAYGPNQVPPVNGTKSLAFAEKIYLPHLKQFHKIDFNPAVLLVMKKIHYNLDMEKVVQARIAKDLEKKINGFKSQVANQGLFASNSPEPVPAATNTKEKQPGLN